MRRGRWPAADRTRWGRLRLAPVLAGALTAALLVAAAPATATAVPPSPPVHAENQRQGTTGWRIPWGGHSVASDAGGQVKGYTGATSYRPGDPVDFRVSARPAQNVTVDVYRLGWYQGQGGRFVHHSGWRAATTQRTCTPESGTGLIRCGWGTTYTVPGTVTASWPSGLYVAVVTGAARYQNWVPFVVRDGDRRAPVLVQVATSTWQAYNRFPRDGVNGKSLYEGYPPITVSGTNRAVKVSHDRPYEGNGAGLLFEEVLWATQYLERMGYDIGYATSEDLHSGRVDPAAYDVFLSPEHDEYYSRPMFDSVQRARDTGTHLGYLGANNAYWQIRYEGSERVVVCYRDGATDPTTDPALVTLRWRDIGRPEQGLLGSMYSGMMSGSVPLRVTQSGSWPWRGTGVTDGTGVGKAVGGEADKVHDGVAVPASSEFLRLSRTQFLYRGTTDRYEIQESVAWRTPGGARVFNAGSLDWAPSLAHPDFRDDRVERLTANVLASMVQSSAAGSVERAAGADRYETASALSRSAFAPGVPTVHLATGEAFPDALAAAPAAAVSGGPVLLTRTSTLPQSVRQELLRLGPGRVVVVGGSSAVADQVVDQVRQALGGVTVERVAGADRYATAAALATRTWGPGAPVAYVASGEGFPDALAASGAAGALGGPVLLARVGGLPPATSAELSRLRPRRAVVVGGTSVLGTGVETATRGYAPTVRAAGSNRFLTSYAVARDAFAAGSGGTAVVATGLDFPDGLSGGAVAGAGGGPLLLTGASTPQQLLVEARRSGLGRVVVAGGPSAVPESALQAVRVAVGSPAGSLGGGG